MKRAVSLLAAGLVMAATPALSQPQPATPPTSPETGTTGETVTASNVDQIIARDAKEKEDMGAGTRTICRDVEQIGTRLSSKKVCATASEWAAMRSQQREGVERVQTGRWKNN